MNNPSEKFFLVEVRFGPMDPAWFFLVRDELGRNGAELGQIVIGAAFESDEPGKLETPAGGVTSIEVRDVSPSEMRNADRSNEIKIEMTSGIQAWRLPV